MALPATAEPYWPFPFSSGMTSRNTTLLFLEKKPLGRECIWGSPSAWALTWLYQRTHYPCFILQRRSEQLAPTLSAWGHGRVGSRASVVWAADLTPYLLPLDHRRVYLAQGLLPAPGVLVYLLSDNSFDSLYYQANNLKAQQKHQKIETEKEKFLTWPNLRSNTKQVCNKLEIFFT